MALQLEENVLRKRGIEPEDTLMLDLWGILEELKGNVNDPRSAQPTAWEQRRLQGTHGACQVPRDRGTLGEDSSWSGVQGKGNKGAVQQGQGAGAQVTVEN